MWFSDERCVAPDDERSNYGMAKESLLDPLGEPARCRRSTGCRASSGPRPAPTDYERELARRGPPRFDLVLLGIGPDGHCASLFPDQASLSERSRLVVGVRGGRARAVRPARHADPSRARERRQIVFLATGESKADAVAAAFGPDAKPDPHVPPRCWRRWRKDDQGAARPAAPRALESAAERA